MSDKAAGQKARSPEGCDENGPAAALLLSHVSISICSFLTPCRRPILIATPLYQSLTWCTSLRRADQAPSPASELRSNARPPARPGGSRGYRPQPSVSTSSIVLVLVLVIDSIDCLANAILR